MQAYMTRNCTQEYPKLVKIDDMLVMIYESERGRFIMDVYDTHNDLYHKYTQLPDRAKKICEILDINPMGALWVSSII